MRLGITFAMFYPEFLNIHLQKDVGTIPYILQREFGYESYIICYKNEEFRNTLGLKFVFIKDNPAPSLRAGIKKVWGWIKIFVEIIPFFMKHGKNLKVVGFEGFNFKNVISSWIYKLFQRKGISYLRADLDSNFRSFPSNPIRKVFQRITDFLVFLSFDLVSVESKRFYKHFPKKVRKSNRLLIMPMGTDVRTLEPFGRGFANKENIILHVGRIGAYQKASDVVLKAVEHMFTSFPDWKLVLIGSIEKNFKKYLHDFITTRKLEKNVYYVGFVEKKKLYEYYSRAKILLLPSRFEGFPVILPEAGIFGVVVIGSDIPVIREITKGGKLGYLCKVDDVKCFSHKIREAISNEGELKKKSELFRKLIREKYDWAKICLALHRSIQRVGK